MVHPTGNYLYRRIVAVWGTEHWRSDVTEWIRNNFQCDSVYRVDSIQNINWETDVILVSDDEPAVKAALIKHLERNPDLCWYVIDTPEIDDLYYRIQNGTIAVEGPLPVNIKATDTDYGTW